MINKSGGYNMTYKEYSFPSNTKFLVTGGAGFIGSNIAEKILTLGYKVRVLDNFSTGKAENIKEFINLPNFELMIGDIRNIEDCKKACKKIDYVLHHAAIGSVPKSVDDPKTTNDTNITGTLNMLIASVEHKIKRFIYASSSSVYGDESSSFKSEEKIGSLLSPYAVTKLTNELYATTFLKLYQLPTIGLRYFNVYGKKQDPFSKYASVVPEFVKKLMNNQAVIIFDDGMQSRDFIYIDDVIESNLKACVASQETYGKVFNIGCGKKIYIKDLYYKISKILNKEVEAIYSYKRKGDVDSCVADINRARVLLKFTPKFGLDEGLIKTIEWYKN
jgi:UDP-N-acetylglucosamine 4-epimerase